MRAVQAYLAAMANGETPPPATSEPPNLAAFVESLSSAPVETVYRVLFTRTADLVQRSEATRQQLLLEAAIAKLDRHDLLVLEP
jgi:hypothetical protein